MRQRLARLLPATLIAGVLTLAPAASTVTPAHALQFSDLNKIQRRNLSGFLHAEMTGQQAVSTTAAQQLRQHAKRVQPASTPRSPTTRRSTPRR